MIFYTPSRRREGIVGRAGSLTENIAGGLSLPQPLPQAEGGEEGGEKKTPSSTPHIV